MGTEKNAIKAESSIVTCKHFRFVSFCCAAGTGFVVCRMPRHYGGVRHCMACDSNTIEIRNSIRNGADQLDLKLPSRRAQIV